MSTCTNPWYMTYSVLPFPVIEPTLHGLGFPGQFQGLDQLWKSRTKTNLKAKYWTPECHWQPAPGIFKGFKIHITKNFTRRLGRVKGKKTHVQKAWFLRIRPYDDDKENSPKWTGWMEAGEAWWMSFSFWLSISHSWFSWEYGWFHWPCKS